MYYEKNVVGLSFSDLIRNAKKEDIDDKIFPYTPEICRCRYCKYCHEGKCALKRCCCMKERVRARSCKFTEILEDVFETIKDNVFHFRLRIAEERAAELKTCFLDSEHRKRFYEGCTLTRKNEYSFIAQIFLLSISETMWQSAKDVLYSGRIDYSNMDIRRFGNNDYLYFCAAMDLQYGSSHTGINDLSNDEVIDFDAFRMICHAVAIFVYGMDTVRIAEKKRKVRGKRYKGKARKSE